MRTLPIFVFIGLLAAAGIFIALLVADLPDVVAVHFDAAGRADGFATREASREFMLAFTLGTPMFVMLVTALLPRVLPASMVNVPNRAYWLAPERSRETLAYLSGHGTWFACLLVIFLTVVAYLLVRANLTQPPVFPTRLLIAALLMLFASIGVWALCMFRRFAMP